MPDDLESLRQRAQALANQQEQARQDTIEVARKAARSDFERWKEEINLAIKRGQTFILVSPRSGALSISGVETVFGNPKKQYGWAIAQEQMWQSSELYKTYGDELQKLLGGHPFHVWLYISEPDSGAEYPRIQIQWGKERRY